MIIIMANILIVLVAVLHVYFLILEIFLWDKPFGLRTFGHTQASASASKILAMNQGLYNGFLAAGLAWGLSLGAAGDSIKVFFLACIVIAGVFGGLTASRKILVVQAVPAAAALALVFLSEGATPQEPVGLRDNLLRWRESGPNTPDFSLRRPTMRLKIMTICPRSPTR